jgi:hypothetical protein
MREQFMTDLTADLGVTRLLEEHSQAAGDREANAADETPDE